MNQKDKADPDKVQWQRKIIYRTLDFYQQAEMEVEESVEEIRDRDYVKLK